MPLANSLPWQGGSKPFNYLSQVQPILDKHCVSCHDFGGEGAHRVILAGDKNFAFNISYNELQSKGFTGAIGAGPAGHLPALSWGSHTSKLIKHLKEGHLEENEIKMSKEEMDTLVTWIDLNAPYYPTGLSSRNAARMGRSPLSQEDVDRFFKVNRIDGLHFPSRQKL